jgi:hypothetical protein
MVNCLDCATEGQISVAVAMCVTCGGAVCQGHAQVRDHVLTRTVIGGMSNLRVSVEPPARLVRCACCDAADEAARQGDGRRGGKAKGKKSA